ncbi:MAG: tetratricopeptide repeat protein [Bacteroidaceae bacterium]|nr:tetratricopeptide repeat protein [Bacteroidaceae bacterium]
MKEKMQQVLDLCNKNDFDKALVLLEEIIKEEPQNSEAWRILAQIHWVNMHMPDQAIDELIESLKCNPKNIWALVLMGNLLVKEKNDIEHGKNYYDKVLEYYPDNAIAINNIGATFMEKEEYEQALPYLKKALDINDSYANSYYGLGLCYYKMGNLKEAFDVCFKGAKKSVDRPENPAIREELIKLYLTVAKDLANETNYINVWKGIKDELEEIDHRNIRITEDKSLTVSAKLEYAPLHAANEHVIRYNPEKNYVEHLFIHEMMHLKMNQQSSIANRGKAVISSENTRRAFKNRYYTFMKNTHKGIPVIELNRIIVDLAEGMGLQLMNCPLDLFVEHLMYSQYKVVRPIQLLSLFHMEKDNINSVRQAKKTGFFPKEILYANKVMNIVTSMHFKDLYGINLIGQYQPTKQEFEHAKDLYEEFKAYLPTYKPGDEYEMVEYFVQSFNMEDFVMIVDEDEVSPAMKTDLSMKGDIADLAESALSKEEVEEANADFAEKHKDGVDPTETMMMSMYMLGAMEFLDTLEPRDVHRIALEIAMVGVTGINPKNKYTIKSLPGKEFGGYELLAYYYVSWSRALPDKLDQLGLPFSNAYKTAMQMYNAKHNK